MLRSSTLVVVDINRPSLCMLSNWCSLCSSRVLSCPATKLLSFSQPAVVSQVGPLLYFVLHLGFFVSPLPSWISLHWWPNILRQPQMPWFEKPVVWFHWCIYIWRSRTSFPASSAFLGWRCLWLAQTFGNGSTYFSLSNLPGSSWRRGSFPTCQWRWWVLCRCLAPVLPSLSVHPAVVLPVISPSCPLPVSLSLSLSWSALSLISLRFLFPFAPFGKREPGIFIFQVCKLVNFISWLGIDYMCFTV